MKYQNWQRALGPKIWPRVQTTLYMIAGIQANPWNPWNLGPKGPWTKNLSPLIQITFKSDCMGSDKSIDTHIARFI